MTATKTRTIRLADYTPRGGTLFHQMPVDGGQIVDVNYAMLPDGHGGGKLLRCTHDRSDGEVSYEIANLILDSENEDSDTERFEPWNGILPAHGAWKDCADVGILVI